MVGGSLSQIFKSLVFGRLMSFGSKKMRFLTTKANINDLEFLVKLQEEGKIKSVIDRRYSLDKTADAMNYLSEGHSRGKVVIIV
jgi:NADPH:quinone reductase-like Zn-dependent oxidoreductase